VNKKTHERANERPQIMRTTLAFSVTYRRQSTLK